MRRDFVISFLLFALTALGVSVFAIGLPKKPVADNGTLRKAEYLYLESCTAISEERYDDARMLRERAAALAPDDAFIGAALAELTYDMPTTDSLSRTLLYGKIRDRFYVMPDDDHYAQAYVYYASKEGRTDEIIAVYELLDSLQPARTDPAMNLATALLQRYSRTLDMADYNRALTIFERLERSQGPTMQLTSRKIGALSLRNDTAAMVGELTALAAAAPADVQTNVFVGRLFAALEMPDSALRYYNIARDLGPEDGTVNLARAEFFNHMRDSVAFDREVFLTLQSPMMPFEAKMQLLTEYVSKLYTDSLQYPRIEQMFETMQEVNPGEADLHALYGAYKATVGDYTTAADQFSYSIDLNPDNDGLWHNLTQIYFDAKDYDSALLTARRGMQYFPGDYILAVSGAMVLMQKEQYGRAVALLDSIDFSALPHPKAASSIYATRGDILYKLGMPDSAFAAYNKAIDLNPDNYMAMNNAAYYMAVADGNLDLAQTYASIACGAEPENATYLDTYAWVLFKRKDYTKARDYIDRALRTYGQDSAIEVDGSDAGEAPAEQPIEASGEIFDHAGDIYFMTGDHKDALYFWKKALKAMPDDELLKKKVKHKTIFFE